jgi:hypothetical protein
MLAPHPPRSSRASHVWVFWLQLSTRSLALVVLTNDQLVSRSNNMLERRFEATLESPFATIYGKHITLFPV